MTHCSGIEGIKTRDCSIDIVLFPVERYSCNLDLIANLDSTLTTNNAINPSVGSSIKHLNSEILFDYIVTQ